MRSIFIGSLGVLVASGPQACLATEAHCEAPGLVWGIPLAGLLSRMTIGNDRSWARTNNAAYDDTIKLIRFETDRTRRDLRY